MIRKFKNWISLILKSKPTKKPIQDKPLDIPQPIQLKPADNPKRSQKIDVDFHFADGSHHHPQFNVTEYPAPLFINKCTEGTSFVDRTHADRKLICENEGIIYGGYHFFRTNRDWKEQCDFYLNTHGPFSMPPIIDYETTKGQNESDLMEHKSELLLSLQYLEKATGMTPIVYLNYSAAKRLKFSDEFGKYPAWFARYNKTLGAIPAPWTPETTFAWQFTETGEFSGLKPGDVNVYYAKSKVLK